MVYAAALPDLFGQSETAPKRIIVNNRVLAKINGKPISVLDVMKKMDLIFYREHPDLEESLVARYQFYMINWKTVLSDMIDGELILANAAEVKVTVSEGDVRQELEELFGPNVVLTIDKMGLTYEEAVKLVQNELTIKRMTSYMVHSKSLNRIGPEKIREVYENYAKEHPREASWDYQLVSIRGPNQLRNLALAEAAYQMLVKDKISLCNLVDALENSGLADPSTSIAVSDDLQRTDTTISDEHKQILSTLAPGRYSKPLTQTSRVDKTTVYRIFFLKSHTAAGKVPYAEVEAKIKAQLEDKIYEEESITYRQKLRSRFGVCDDLDAMLPKGFQPFILS